MKTLQPGECVFVALTTLILASSWIAAGLAGLGRFSLAALLVLVATVAAGLVWLNRSRARSMIHSARRPGIETWALVGILAAAGFLVGRPHEFIVGGADAGVYVNTGVNLARTGRLLIHDSTMAAVPAESVPALVRAGKPDGFSSWIRLPGYYVEGDITGGNVTPQFFPLQSLWVAVLYSLAGLPAALWTAPVFSLLAVLAVYFAVRAVTGRPDLALLAAGLLAVSPLQVWFARYPTSEAATQFLIFSGAYAFARFLESGDRYLGILAGACWGTVYLTRFEPPLLLLVIGAYVLVQSLRGHRLVSYAAFVISWLGVTACALVYALSFSRPYTLSILRAQFGWLLSRGSGIWPGVVALAVGTWVWWMLSRRRGLRATALARLDGGAAARWIGVFVVAGWAAYQYFVRPVVEHANSYYYWYADTMVTTANQENLVRLGWYMTPLGIALGVAGAMWLIHRELSSRNVWFFGLLGLYTFVFVLDIANNPHQVYAMRRYMPVVVPAFCIGAAYALHRLWSWSRRWPIRALAVALAAILVTVWLLDDRLWAGQSDYAGITDQVAKLAAGLSSRDVVVFNATGTGNALGTPLTYIFGKPAFALQPDAQPGQVASAIRTWTQEGRRVIWADVASDIALPPETFTLKPLENLRIDVPVLEASYSHRPTAIQRWIADVSLYEVSGPSNISALLGADIGELDLGVLVDGFHGPERMSDGRTFRWTGGEARLRLVWPPGQDSARLVLRLNGGRPAGVPPANVALWVGNRLVQTMAIENDWREYEVDLNRPGGDELADDRVEIQLRTNTWSPVDYGLGEDSRVLGIMVDSIAIR